MNQNERMAELLLPNITKEPDYYENLFPERQLPEGARVVRIAPSPRGYLHLGTLFMSLVNRITADSTNGIFFLRIEDTDKKREIEGGIDDIINGLELKDVTVVVTRYFGGILLGTGGLVRAYSKAVKDALESSEMVLMVPGDIISARCDYNLYDRFEKILKDFDADIISSEFTDRVNLEFSVPESVTVKFIDTVNDKLSSRVRCELVSKKYTKEKILKEK